MALLTFSLFCFVPYCYAFVQYCIVNTIQYNAMHKFIVVLDFNPLRKGNLFCQNWYVKGKGLGVGTEAMHIKLS